MTNLRPETIRHKRWKARAAAGLVEQDVPVGPAAAHVRALLNSGCSRRSIARAARISHGTVNDVARSARALIDPATEKAILAVTPNGNTGGAYRPAIGASRRVKALMAMGWRHPDIQAVMNRHGVSARSHTVMHQDVITHRTHYAVDAAYRELCMTFGPSERHRAWAARRGWAPPLAWDDDSIDDPAARPQGVRRAA